MVFSSITFVYAFFPLVAVAYYLSKNRVYRNVVLLLASLLFYSWGEPRFLLLMLAATLAAYCGGLLMERCTAHRKLILIVTVVLLVGNLFVFKYLNFFIKSCHFFRSILKTSGFGFIMIQFCIRCEYNFHSIFSHFHTEVNIIKCNLQLLVKSSNCFKNRSLYHHAGGSDCTYLLHTAQTSHISFRIPGKFT